MVVGVDVGGTKIVAALVARDGSLHEARSVPTPLDGCVLVARLTALVEEVAAVAPEPVGALGVGLPSMIERQSRRVRASVNVDLADVDVAADLERRLGLPVAIDNDVNIAMLAEHRLGAARGAEDAVLIAVGTGIGGGIVAGGKIFRGGRGTGAELGHVVVQANGPPCQRNCPNRGCLETMASGTAIARDAGVSAPVVVERARTGDPVAVEVLARAGRYLGVGIASLANVLNPEVVVIGGGLTAAGELLLGPAREEYRARALAPNAGARVVIAALGARAQVVGAGLVAWDLLGECR